MNKNILYISKYLKIESENSPGSRSWMLLKEMQRNFCNVTLITSSFSWSTPLKKEKSISIIKENIKLIILRVKNYKKAKSLHRVYGWIEFEIRLFFLNLKHIHRPDLIVVSSLSLLTIINGVYLAKKFNSKLVFEIRDIWPLTLTEEGGMNNYNPLIIFLSFIEKFGYRNSDIIIGTMPNLSKHIHNVLPNLKTPIYCVPMGISQSMLNNLEPVDTEYKAKYLSSYKFKVVYAGTVGITNALEKMFELAIYTSKKNENIEFIIIGEGPLLDHYKTKYGQLSNLIFAPKIVKKQVNDALQSADILFFSVFDSKVWEYGQSLNKIIDYMLSGRPILGYYPGFQSMINEAKCGKLVTASEISELYKSLDSFYKMDKSKRDRMGDRGRLWLQKNRDYKLLAKKFNDYIFSD